MRNVVITVRGRVQGVWFRKYTRDKALALDIKGFVKNQVDGSVYIEASGPDGQVDSLIQWCWEGSPMSNVDQVTVEEMDTIHQKPFSIKS